MMTSLAAKNYRDPPGVMNIDNTNCDRASCANDTPIHLRSARTCILTSSLKPRSIAKVPLELPPKLKNLAEGVNDSEVADNE